MQLAAQLQLSHLILCVNRLSCLTDVKLPTDAVATAKTHWARLSYNKLGILLVVQPFSKQSTELVAGHGQDEECCRFCWGLDSRQTLNLSENINVLSAGNSGYIIPCVPTIYIA